MSSEYDNSIWQLVPPGGEPDPRLAARADNFAAAGTSILDLGCGDGKFLQALGQAGAVVLGADRSTVALARAAQRVDGVALHEVLDNERLPLADNCVDRVWCCDTLEHVVDTQTVLSEARRVLRPGGKLLVITPNHSRWLRLRLALRGWDQHFDPFSPHLRFYSAASLSGALTDCGFERPTIERDRGALIALADRR